MATRLDSRQSRQRALLDQLSNNTDVKLDTLLNLANDELTQPLRLRQSVPTNLRLNIDAISVKTEDGAEGHGRSRTIQPIQGVLPSFTAGYIEFPSASAGSIVAVGLTLAASYTLTVSSGNWIKVLVSLNTSGQIVLTFGTQGASESAATLPTPPSDVFNIGYVSIQNSGGTIQNVTGARIYQFSGGGGGTSATVTAHIAASSGVHGVTGAVVGTTDTQSLTNKTLNDTSNVILKGGNATGTILRIGTTDANPLILEAQGNANFRINSSANLAIEGDGGFSSSVRGFVLPRGAVAQRPSAPQPGTVRLNTDSNEFEGYANSTWQAIGGGINEQPLKNYLKTYATAAVSPGALSTVAAGGNITPTVGLFYSTSTGTAFALASDSSAALRGSTNYLSATNTAANVDGSVFFQFPATALEAVDLGKPVSISLDVTGLTTAGWDVVVVRYSSAGVFQGLIPVAGNASTSTSTPSALLPTGTAQFRGFFVASSTAGDLYALRFRRITGAEQVRLDTLYVGPQTQLMGAAVTSLSARTLTYGGATFTETKVQFRQVGDCAHIDINIVASANATSDITLDISAIGAIDSTKVGTSQGLGSGIVRTDIQNSIIVPVFDSGNIIKFLDDEGGFIGATHPSTSGGIDTGDRILCSIVVPIANWSSNVTMAGRAVEEYASNSNATNTATDTTSFAYGSAGSLVPNGAVGTNYTRRIQFQTPVQATDAVLMEVNDGAGWSLISDTLGPYVAQGSNSYGLSIDILSGLTTADVVFRTGGFAPTNATYAGNGDAWSAISAYRWRVRKVSGGAAVGYPVGARNVVGDVTGTAVPAGYIGELLSTQRTRAARGTAATSATVNVTATNITLTPGAWTVRGGVGIASNGSTSGSFVASISTTSATVTNADDIGKTRWQLPNANLSGSDGSITLGGFTVVVAANTAYYLVFNNGAAGTVDYYGYIEAVRIA